MPIPEDKARKLAELEAQVAKEPSNPNLHRKWITERVNAECIPGGGENPRRIAMISWAVVELKRRLSMPPVSKRPARAEPTRIWFYRRTPRKLRRSHGVTSLPHQVER